MKSLRVPLAVVAPYCEPASCGMCRVLEIDEPDMRATSLALMFASGVVLSVIDMNERRPLQVAARFCEGHTAQLVAAFECVVAGVNGVEPADIDAMATRLAAQQRVH